MKEILFQRKIPVTRQVDVFIAGGGPAGLAAAVTAARMGASVFLAEKHQSFGGRRGAICRTGLHALFRRHKFYVRRNRPGDI